MISTSGRACETSSNKHIRAGSSNIITRCTLLPPESALAAPTGPCHYENFHAFELCGAEPHIHTTYFLTYVLCCVHTNAYTVALSIHFYTLLTPRMREAQRLLHWTGFLFTVTCLPYYRRMTVTRPFRQFFAGAAWKVGFFTSCEAAGHRLA